MAVDRLADPSSGLKPLTTLSVNQLTHDELRAQMSVLLERLDALVHTAAHAGMHELSESVVYIYFTIMDDELQLLQAVYDRLVSQAWLAPTNVDNGHIT